MNLPVSDGKIQLLPPLVAERIAAGEVIERPASVVKELVENSIDAGATAVEVRLGRGGCELIEITDNGSGMAPSDLEISICRHATSKIRAFEDLNKLMSLGFRGEALPSIASVAELQITSRAKGSEGTHEIRLAHQASNRAESKRVANVNLAGSPHGTRVRVLSLFSQIPARLKFLKSAGAEANAVREILERLALTHPEVRILLLNDERELLNLPSETLEQRAERMLANGNPFDLRHVKIEGSWNIEIIWLKGLSFPHTRSLYQIVNGRALRDRIVQQAVLSPLKQSFLPGNFPAMVVKLDVPADQLDVNAHPTKTEIRFLDSGKVFAICHAAIERLLREATPSFTQVLQTAGAEPDSLSRESENRGADFRYSPAYVNQASQTNEARGSYAPPAYATQVFSQEILAPSRDQKYSEEDGSSANSAAHGTLTKDDHENSSFSSFTSAYQNFESTPFGQYKGILFSTYFIFEQGRELLLIDQHAAHERIRYEKLKRSILGKEVIEQQELLVPEVIKFSRNQIAEVSPKLPVLHTLGFDVETFGEDSFVFRSLPAVWGAQNLTARLKNLLERLEFSPLQTKTDAKSDRGTETIVWDETLFEKIAMEACRSSFKARDRIPAEAAIDLTQKLMECEHPGNCPHGRPTFIRIPESKFEEWFNRKV
jgi:DNA mismatch repair protein MutL